MTREERLLVIEIAGLPGAGKSTTLSEFAHRYGDAFGVQSAFSLESPYRDLKLFRQLQHVVRFAIRDWRAAMITARFWARSTRWNVFSFKRVLRCWALADRIDQRKRQSGGGAFVLDQGFLQAIGSLAIPALSSTLQDVAPALKSIMLGRIDAVIWLECPRALAEARRLGRTHGPSCFDAADQQRASADLERFERAICAARTVASSAGIPTLEINAQDLVDKNAMRIADWIADLTEKKAPLRTYRIPGSCTV